MRLSDTPDLSTLRLEVLLHIASPRCQLPREAVQRDHRQVQYDTASIRRHMIEFGISKMDRSSNDNYFYKSGQRINAKFNKFLLRALISLSVHCFAEIQSS